MSKKIAVIGECMIELSEKGAAVNRGFGGDTLNTSVYIARQTDASELGVHYVTALGTDTFSQQMLESWQSENVQTDLIQRMADRLPGLYYIETDDTGERTFYTGVMKPQRSSGWRASSLRPSAKSWRPMIIFTSAASAWQS
jgi:Sugar kinases, ribokinase family